MNKYALLFSENQVPNFDDLVNIVIKEINDIPYDQMLSGERFLNLWEEFAVQVQIEESYCFYVHEEIVKTACEVLVDVLPQEVIILLWEKSNAYLDWDEEDDEPDINIMRDGVREELLQLVYNAAADYQLPSYREDEETSDSRIIYGRINYHYDEAVVEIIKKIRCLPRSSMQSGADSPYEDVWEEYAAQIQIQESLFFEIYEDLVISICNKFVNELTEPNLRRLWEWCDEGQELHTEEMKEAVAAELFRRVQVAAANVDLPDYDDQDDVDEDEECECDGSEGFHLSDFDFDAIQVARDVIRLLLSQPITPKQVVGLGRSLYALGRLPKVTPGIYCKYGVCYRTGDEKYSEMRYISFLISEDEFEISTGGSVYDQSVGGDSFSGPGWRIETGGFAERTLGYGLHNLEDSICEYLNLGAEITVDDDSDNIEFEDE